MGTVIAIVASLAVVFSFGVIPLASYLYESIFGPSDEDDDLF